MVLKHSLEDVYEKICTSIHICFPGSELPSFYQVKWLLCDFTGVMSIVSHMCIKSCVAFIGPYADLNTCPECGEPHFDQLWQNRGNKCPHAVFHTIPIDPQLQALWRHPESVDKMSYHAHKMQQILDSLLTKDGLVDAYNDIFLWQCLFAGSL